MTMVAKAEDKAVQTMNERNLEKYEERRLKSLIVAGKYKSKPGWSAWIIKKVHSMWINVTSEEWDQLRRKSEKRQEIREQNDRINDDINQSISSNGIQDEIDENRSIKQKIFTGIYNIAAWLAPYYHWVFIISIVFSFPHVDSLILAPFILIFFSTSAITQLLPNHWFWYASIASYNVCAA
ncbi:MAG: hypothetical protein EZS28_054178, partial [Streblomastix strix]